MTIELTPKQEEFVQRQVALGGYRSADEVLAVALRTLEERGESLAPVSDIRAKVLRGIAQLDRGEFSSKSFEDIAEEGRRRFSELGE